MNELMTLKEEIRKLYPTIGTIRSDLKKSEKCSEASMQKNKTKESKERQTVAVSTCT